MLNPIEEAKKLRREIGDEIEARILTRQARSILATLKDLKPEQAPIHDAWLEAMKG